MAESENLGRGDSRIAGNESCDRTQAIALPHVGGSIAAVDLIKGRGRSTTEGVNGEIVCVFMLHSHRA